jgi:small conductance mechanosensitive channel
MAWWQTFSTWFSTDGVRLLGEIGGPLLVAFLVAQLSGFLSRRALGLGWLAFTHQQASPERVATLRGLVASAITLLAFVVAGLVILSRYVSAETLVWVVGLFSAAFGFAARPVVSDWLAGISFIFRDTFDVGDKVEFQFAVHTVEGVIEAVNVSYCLLRSTTGEIYTVPNGEIRVVRNFTRGAFSGIKLKLSVPAADLNRALAVLDQIGRETPRPVPGLHESWRVITTDEAAAERVELMVIARAEHGQGADLKVALLALIQRRLAEAGIQQRMPAE